MKLTLISLNQEDRGKQIEVDKAVFRIGRSEENDLVLPKKYISRKHALIEKKDGEFVLKDLGSRNPTFVNKVPITEHVLQNGDLIEICDFQFQAVLEEEEDLEGTALWDPQLTQGGADVHSVVVGGEVEILEEEEGEEEESETDEGESSPGTSSVLQPISSRSFEKPSLSLSEVEMNMAVIEESDVEIEVESAPSISFSPNIEESSVGEESAVEFEPLDIPLESEERSSPESQVSFTKEALLEEEEEESYATPARLEDEEEGTAIVDLESVIATKPPVLEEDDDEEEEKDENLSSFTGSLAELLAKKSSPAKPKKSRSLQESLPKEQPSSIQLHLGEDDDDDDEDDDDEGTAVVEIQVGVEEEEEEEEGTDVLSSREKEKTAQLSAIRKGRKKGGKLATADAVVVQGEVEEDEEEEEEDDYLDLDQTGSFDVTKFRAKKESQKKREIFAAIGICSAIFVILIAGYYLLTAKKEPRVENLKPLKLVVGKKEVKEWQNPGENPIQKLVVYVQEEGKVRKKELKLGDERDLFEDDYLRILHYFRKANPTFFIFVPKKAFPKERRMAIDIQYKDGSIHRFRVTIRKAPKTLSEKEKLLREISSLSRYERRQKVRELISSADKLWEDRLIPGNESYFEKARRKYEKALWIVESYQPEGFDEDWDREFNLVRNKLIEYTTGKKAFLKRLEKEFLSYYRRGQKSKAKATLDRILRLLSYEKNSLNYIKFKLIRKNLF